MVLSARFLVDCCCIGGFNVVLRIKSK
jgi:hypothetical protein